MPNLTILRPKSEDPQQVAEQCRYENDWIERPMHASGRVFKTYDVIEDEEPIESYSSNALEPSFQLKSLEYQVRTLYKKWIQNNSPITEVLNVLDNIRVTIISLERMAMKEMRA